MLLLLACTGTADVNTDVVPHDSSEPIDTDYWDPRFDDLVASIEAERVALGAPGVAVAILESGEVTFARGFGSKDPDADDPVLASTLFRIGSINKMLTATALLQQIERSDTVTLETTLGELGLGPDWAPDVRLHDLLTHQGGFVDYTPISGSPDDEALLSYAQDTFPVVAYPMNPPGLFWNYANPNYAFAGLVAQELDGRFYRELLDEEVFTPLGMDRTFFLGEEVIADGDFAYAESTNWFTGEGTLRVEPDSYDHAFTRPAGLAWSSVYDMLAFAEFLMEGDPAVLDDHTPLRSDQVNTLNYADVVHYGYGVITVTGISSSEGWYEVPLWTHSGAVPGFAADMYILPDQEVAIVVLANANGAYFSQSVNLALTTLVELPEPTFYPSAEVRQDFSRYEGHYFDQYSVGNLIVALEDGKLTLDAPELDTVYEVGPTLEPTSRDNFILTLDGYGYEVTLIGEPTQYLRHRYFVAARGSGMAPTTATGRIRPSLLH